MPLSSAIAVSIAFAAPAQATTADPAQLRYEVSDGIVGCPDAEGLRGAVATRLGYDPFREDARRLLTTRIARAGHDLRADIELRDENGALVGARSLTGRGCGDLASAIAFAISMAIDPVRAMAPPTIATPPPAAPEALATAPAPRDEPAPPVRAETPRTPFIPRVHAGAGLAALGPVAGVTALLMAGGGVRYGAAAIDLEGHFLPPSSTSVPGGTVRTSTLAVALLPCAYVEPLYFCGNVTVGALQGEAEGVDAPDKATTVFVQAGARLGVAIPVSARLTLEPFIDGLATLTRTRINFRGQEVWSTTGFGFSGGGRVAVHFP